MDIYYDNFVVSLKRGKQNITLHHMYSQSHTKCQILTFFLHLLVSPQRLDHNTAIQILFEAKSLRITMHVNITSEFFFSEFLQIFKVYNKCMITEIQ